MKKRDKSKLALLFKKFFIKIQTNMNEREREREREREKKRNGKESMICLTLKTSQNISEIIGVSFWPP